MSEERYVWQHEHVVVGLGWTITEGGGLPLEQGGRGKLALAQWHVSRVHDKMRRQMERRLFRMITDPPLYPPLPATPPT